ncbi:hypothetical protein Agub_g2542, partial [Astrephomene gubernaculifera]
MTACKRLQTHTPHQYQLSAAKYTGVRNAGLDLLSAGCLWNMASHQRVRSLARKLRTSKQYTSRPVFCAVVASGEASSSPAGTATNPAASTSPASAPAPLAAPSGSTLTTGKDVILRYYQAYNAGDLASISPLLAEQVSYHDMIYSQPFVGRQQVLTYLEKVRRTVPSDLRFVIEDITDGDPRAVGVSWHVECGGGEGDSGGVVFPFSRGCSFYTLTPEGQISSARDLVESAVKPGGAALRLLAAVAPLVRRLGPAAADPSRLGRSLPWEAAAWWAFYAGYTGYIMLGPWAPGAPVYATPPQVLSEVFHESLNFFYVNIALAVAHLNPVPCVPAPPVSEALFNFMAAWSLAALPYMLADGRSRKLGGGGRLAAWWAGIMFLTNVFYIPYLALRAAPEPPPPQPAASSSSPSLSPSSPDVTPGSATTTTTAHPPEAGTATATVAAEAAATPPTPAATPAPAKPPP